MSGAPALFTIGYEATTVDSLVATLKAAGVERLVDVRALPLSRRPGFSKTPLAGALGQAGIEYRHLRALGTPKRGRDAAKKGDVETLRAVYDEQLEKPEAIAEAAILRDLAAEKPTALLCFERDPAHCHRTLLAEAELSGFDRVDLTPG